MSEDVCPVKLEYRLKFPDKNFSPYHEWRWEPKGKDEDSAVLKKGICKLCGFALGIERFCRRCGLSLDRWGDDGSLCRLCVEKAWDESTIPQELIGQVHNKLVLLWGERISQLATLYEVEQQERIMAEEIIRLILDYKGDHR